MLQENPGDAAMTKRLISMYKCNGKTVEAVKVWYLIFLRKFINFSDVGFVPRNV